MSNHLLKNTGNIEEQEINKKPDKGLNRSLKKGIHQLILSEKFNNNPDYAEVRKLAYEILNRNRPKIEREVRTQFRIKEKENYIKLKNKLLNGNIFIEEKDNSLIDKFKRWWANLIS